MELQKFTIQQIRLIEAHFSINPKYKWEKDKQISFGNKFEIKFRQSEKTVFVLLTASSDSEGQPFQYKVSHEGVFGFEPMPAKEDMDSIIHVNCASIIFPYVREVISDLTRRANLQALNLPPFDFAAMHRQKQKKAPEAPQKFRQ
jgi:preprotein translocase subunit SecB